MPQTKTQAAPPKPPNNKKTLAGFPDDEIRALGDRIAQLNGKEADELGRYLKEEINEQNNIRLNR